MPGITPVATGSELDHFKLGEPDSNGPTSASHTADRLNEMAEGLSSGGAHASRVGIFDAAWPISPSEYEAVSGNGIVQVTAVVADRTELPIRTYISTKTGDVPLVLIARREAVEPVEAPIHKVRAFREDSYYLLPVEVALQPGSIMIDFAKHRTGFQLGAPCVCKYPLKKK